MELILPILCSQLLYRDITPCWQFFETRSTCKDILFIYLQSENSRTHHFRYGGIYERGSREYTLDDFHALQLDKLEKYLCLKESDVIIPDGDVESSSDDDDEDDDDGNEDGDDDDNDDNDEDEDEDEEGLNVEVEDDEDDEEGTAEIASKSREEDQQTTKVEKQANPVDEEFNLSKVSYIYLSF